MQNNLNNLSVEELKALQKKYYQKAEDDNLFLKIAQVARVLGEDPGSRFPPKYVWNHNDIDIFVDDYGRFMTVTLKGKLVCSTHPCENLFIPGDWTNEVLIHYKQAQEKLDQIRMQQEQAEKEQLVEKLSLP